MTSLTLLTYLVSLMLAPAMSFSPQDSQSPPPSSPPSRELPDRKLPDREISDRKLPDRGYGLYNTHQKSGPEIRRQSGSWVIELPRTMEAALKRYNRRFEIWDEQTFPRGKSSGAEMSRYLNSTRQLPWGVIGDFNGDGTVDAAVSGNDERQMLVLLVLSQKGGGYKVIRLDSEPYSPDNRAAVSPPQLSYVYPGKYYTTASERVSAATRVSERKNSDRREKKSGVYRKAVELEFPGISLAGGYRSSAGNTVFQIVDDEVVQLFDLEPISPARRSR